MTIRYKIVSPKTGKLEPWTGKFLDPSLADAWYETHGKEWEAKGKRLVRVVTEK
jgi:hypothetical protein